MRPHTLHLALACAFSLFSSSALAASPWGDSDDAAARDALRARHGVRLDPDAPAAWEGDHVADLLAGLDALPAPIAAAARGVTLRRARRACLFGSGRYSDDCPTFDRDGAFFVYDVPPVQGQGAVRTLEALNEVERVRLQRRRAAVHLAIARYDLENRWSSRRRWLMINSWDSSGSVPYNTDPWGYSRYLGRRSAHLDLVTFAEEFFARPEDVLRDSTDPGAAARLDALDPNVSLACQYFTKIRTLRGFVTEVDAAWRPPLRGLAARGQLDPAAQCPQFEIWADMKNVEGVDILLAAATSDRPESLYGHLLLTVRYDNSRSMRSEGFEPVYQYGAVTDTDVDTITYFTKGLFGGFYSMLQPNTFRGTDRLFMQYEQRTLRRYALNLSPRELRWTLQRIWEAERQILYSYYFLSDNCASMLIDLLAPAVLADMPEPIRFALMPTEVLDVFASADSGDRGSLLVKRAETHFSSREVAMDAVGRRRVALSALREAVGAPADDLTTLDTALDSRDPTERSAAYAKLQARLVELLAGAPAGATRAAIDYLYYSSRVERYFMDLAFYQRRIIQSGALESQTRITAQEQLRIRRELYSIEDLAKRQQALIALARMADSRLREGARRPFTPEEEERLAQIERTQGAYLASLDALASTIETFDPDLDGVAFIDEKLGAFEREQSARDQLSMGPPGKGRLRVGGSAGAAPASGDASPAGFLDVSFSLIHERLGEQRRRGFRSDIESRAFGLDLELRLDDQLAQNVLADFTFFKFTSIEQRPGPVQRSWRDNFGWGIDIGLGHDGRRGMNVGLDARIGYVLPILQRDQVASFVTLAGSIDLRREWGRDSDATPVGATAELAGQLHLGGPYVNVLRASASGSAFVDPFALGFHWDSTAELSLDISLASLNQRHLIIEPFIRARATSLRYVAGEDDPFFVLRAGARVELPF